MSARRSSTDVAVRSGARPPRYRGPGGARWVLAAVVAVAGMATAAARAADPAPRPQAPSPAARAAYTAAAALQNRGAWDLAAAAWEALLRDHPRDALAPRARHYLGVCRLEEGRWEDAAREFRAAIEAAGGAPGGDAETALLARYELARGTFAAAQRSADAAAFRGAVDELRAFLAAAPGGDGGKDRVAEARFLLAEALWQSGDREAALGEWDRFTRDHAGSPRLPDVLYALGVARAEAGDAAGAEATLARFQERFPGHALAAEVAIRRADLALAAGKPVEAARLVVELAKEGDGPRAADALERLGAALYRQERFAASANAYDRLVALRGEDSRADDARLAAAAAWAAAGKEAEARTRLEQVARADPARAAVAEACERLARIMLAAGDAAGALAIAERGLSGSPPAATGARLQLERAEALSGLPGRRDDALAALAKVPADTAEAGAALVLEAALLLEAGRANDARAAADRFLGLPEERRGAGADEAYVRAVRAEALLASGDPRGAAREYAGIIAAAGKADRRAPAWSLRQGAALVAAEDWTGAEEALRGIVAPSAPAGLEADEIAEALLLDATALLELGRPAEALALLERCSRDHAAAPRRHEARLAEVRARRDSGDVAGARSAAEALAADASLPKELLERVRFRLGQVRQDAGDVAGAIEAYRAARAAGAAAADPGAVARAAAGLLAEGWCQEAQGDLAAAEACWSEVIERHAGSGALVPALVARGDVRLRRGAAAEGLADAERAIAAADVPEALGSQATLVAALCEGAAGRHAEAAARLAALAAARPDATDADRVLLELGIAQGRAGDAAAAERTLDGLRARFPRSGRVAEAWLETGESRFAAADWPGAADAYRKVINATRADDAAAASLREQALHKLAWTFTMRDDPGAADAFAAQLEAHPQGACAADGRVMLGDALFRAGRAEEALPVLEEALAHATEISSPDLEALAVVRAAGCEVKQGEGERALGRLDAWWPRAGGPDVSARSRALARFTRADALHRAGRLDEALAAFRGLADEAISGGEGAAAGVEAAARARLMEGEILFEQERHADAIAAFFKVAYGFGERLAPAPLHPWQAQATFEAARCCDVLGKPDQARSLYAELVERFPEAPFVAAARKRIDALGSPGRDSVAPRPPARGSPPGSDAP